MVIINKTTEYPRFPKYPDKYRVEEYWSCMVIKPYTEMTQLGKDIYLNQIKLLALTTLIYRN